ncbi:hypothetical protein ACFLWU_05455 [Chloroflexota bacterium]
MKVLKGFGVGILSFILFLSLSIFGIAFLLNSTVLNPVFVATEIEKIDMSPLIIEIAEEQIGDQLPEEALFVKEAIYEVISEQEPQLKEQINTAIYSGYDFFLGKSDNLNMVISLESLMEGLRESLWQTFHDYLPSELSGLSEDQLKTYFDQYYQDFTSQIPTELELDESFIPPEVMVQMLLVRQYILYFQTGYYALIAFMVLLVIGIILINRNIRDTTRALGIDLVVYGALEFAAVLLARYYTPIAQLLHDIPSSLQIWVSELYMDILAPLQTLSLGILLIGIILLVVSFVYKPQVAED